MTRDPIGYACGINLYAYCRNNPVNYAAPWGYEGCPNGGDNHPGGRIINIGLGEVGGLPGIGGIGGVDILICTNGDIGLDAYAGGGFSSPWKSPEFGYSAGGGGGTTVSDNSTIQTGVSSSTNVTVWGGVLGGASGGISVPSGTINNFNDLVDAVANGQVSGGAKLGPTVGVGLYVGPQYTATVNVSQEVRDTRSAVSTWWGGVCSDMERQIRSM